VFDYQIDVESAGNFAAALEEKYNIVPTDFYMDIGEERCKINCSKLPAELKRKVDYSVITIVEIKISKIFFQAISGLRRLMRELSVLGLFSEA
jgi:hypothetical protein